MTGRQRQQGATVVGQKKKCLGQQCALRPNTDVVKLSSNKKKYLVARHWKLFIFINYCLPTIRAHHDVASSFLVPPMEGGVSTYCTLTAVLHTCDCQSTLFRFQTPSLYCTVPRCRHQLWQQAGNNVILHEPNLVLRIARKKKKKYTVRIWHGYLNWNSYNSMIIIPFFFFCINLVTVIEAFSMVDSIWCI